MSCDLVFPAFQQYEQELNGFLRKRLKNREAPEEVLNQVLLKVYDHCEKLPEVKNVRAWLFTVTRNALYDYFRDQRKHEGDEIAADLISDQSFGSVYQLLEPMVPAMIRMLPAEYAKPLYMSDILQRPQQDIANRLGLSLSATKSRIQRARKKLKDLFFKCCYLELDRNGIPVQVAVKEHCTPLQELVPAMESVPATKDQSCDC